MATKQKQADKTHDADGGVCKFCGLDLEYLASAGTECPANPEVMEAAAAKAAKSEARAAKAESREPLAPAAQAETAEKSQDAEPIEWHGDPQTVSQDVEVERVTWEPEQGYRTTLGESQKDLFDYAQDPNQASDPDVETHATPSPEAKAAEAKGKATQEGDEMTTSDVVKIKPGQGPA